MVLSIIGLILCVLGGGFLGLYIGGVEDSILWILSIPFVILGLILVTIGNFMGKKNVKPNRTTKELTFKCDTVTAKEFLQKLLLNRRFVQIEYGEEKPVFKLGQGVWIARKFVKYDVTENSIVVQAWVSPGMGNRPNTEYPLDDKFVASLPKHQLKKLLDKIEKEFNQKMNSWDDLSIE